MDFKTDSKGLGKKPVVTGANVDAKGKPAKGTQAKSKAQKDVRSEAGKEPESETVNKLAKFLKETRQFLKEVVIEFRKITWPSRPQVIQETYSVIFLVTAITFILLGFDWILGHAVFGPLEHWARIHGGGVGRG